MPEIEREPARNEAEQPKSPNRLAPADAAERLLDDVMPGDLDWRGMVRAYPLPAAVVAAAGGFLLGRQHGTAVLGAVATFAVGELSRSLLAVLDEEPEPNETA